MLGRFSKKEIVGFMLCLLVLAKAEKSSYTRTPKEQKEKSEKLPACKACKILVESFKLGLGKTSRGKHAGGDAAWEEEKLRSYKTSEVRLVEIQEHLCREVQRGQDQCHALANENEHFLEHWFLHEQTDFPELHNWLCIEQLKVCCPEGHFGAECKKCDDCHGNGKCKGDGTRKGNGKCACDTAYNGENCMECAINYYESFRDEKKLLCSSCHVACTKTGCTGAGPGACVACRDGWQFIKDRGCVDINECLTRTDPAACKPNQFCINDEGSFSCLDCDRSCNGCNGDGPDVCLKCADGYKLKNGKCEDVSTEQRDTQASITRFLTYFGLCVATCVIFQSSSEIAYIVGATVAIYIGASEYWLNTIPKAGMKPQIDAKQLEKMLMKSL